MKEVLLFDADAWTLSFINTSGISRRVTWKDTFKCVFNLFKKRERVCDATHYFCFDKVVYLLSKATKS